MSSPSEASSSTEKRPSIHYVVPTHSQLQLQSRILPLNSQESFRHLWQTQSILVLAHIFEVLGHLEIVVNDEPYHQLEGRLIPKPCLIMTRNGADGVPVVEVEENPTRIICEHFYKHYIYTHQVEKRSERVARPIISGDPGQEIPDVSEWVVQPKNSNAVVRKLRGSRKQALLVRIKWLVQIPSPLSSMMLTTTDFENLKIDCADGRACIDDHEQSTDSIGIDSNRGNGEHFSRLASQRYCDFDPKTAPYSLPRRQGFNYP